MMVIGGHMGVRTFVTEAGHHQPEKPEAVEYHFQESVWQQMVATGRQLAALAERHDAVVLMEPFFRGFLASAKRTRLFLEEVGSRRIRALLDPANLLEVNDLDEMFGQLDGTSTACMPRTASCMWIGACRPARATSTTSSSSSWPPGERPMRRSFSNTWGRPAIDRPWPTCATPCARPGCPRIDSTLDEPEAVPAFHVAA